MKNIKLNDREFETKNEIMNAVADSFNANEETLSSEYCEDGKCINVHSLVEGEEESIEWYLDTINYNEDGSVSSVDIDC